MARRTAVALAVSTVLLGGSLGYLAPLDTLIRTADQQAYPDVLPGQVLLANQYSTTFPPPAALLRAADASGALDGRPVELGYSFTTDDSVTRSATRKATPPPSSR